MFRKINEAGMEGTEEGEDFLKHEWNRRAKSAKEETKR